MTAGEVSSEIPRHCSSLSWIRGVIGGAGRWAVLTQKHGGWQVSDRAGVETKTEVNRLVAPWLTPEDETQDGVRAEWRCPVEGAASQPDDPLSACAGEVLGAVRLGDVHVAGIVIGRA